LLLAPIGAADLIFTSSNLLKIRDGAWLPLVMGAALVIIMWTWTRGAHVLSEKTRRDSLPLVELVDMLRARPPYRAPGTAIYLTGDADMAPVALMHNLKHNKVLHALRYGFMETPNLPKALQLCRKQGLKFDIMATSFFLGRRSLVPAAQPSMPLWQDKLFIFLMKNAANPTDFFKIPPGRVVELGAQVTV
jgi:KUP system potassium uptake protein